MHLSKMIIKQYSWILIAAVFCVLWLLLKIGCPINMLTGIPCPGCGMTRAYIALLHLDFRAAFYYHPLFWMVPLCIIVFFIKKGPFANKKIRTAIWSLMIAVLIIVYLLRLFVIKDSVIYFSRI